MTISVNSETHNRILETAERITGSTSDLMNLDAPPTMGMLRTICDQLRRFTSDLERELGQPESLRGCECAIHESHAGKCSGADCYCH
jgi:hypothetical protein